MHSIIANHPFVDGDKRTAFLATQEFLRLNNHQIAADQDEILALTIAIAEGRLGFSDIVLWMNRHVRPQRGN